MIQGVHLLSPPLRADDRGWLVELMKNDEPFFQFGQNTLTMAYPGVIKAFHYHGLQTDYWTFVAGDAQVVLYDLREGARTFKDTQVIYMSGERPQILRIPPYVAHGYRVLGNRPATLMYTVTERYDPTAPDERRLPYDDAEIDFDWSTRPR